MEMDEQVYGLIRKCNVVKRPQLDAFFPEKERAVGRALKRLGRAGCIHTNYLTGMVATNETALEQKDPGTLAALWVLAELKKKGLVEEFFLAGRQEYPVRIVVIGKGEMYDILFVGRQEQELVQSVLRRVYLPDCKHLVITEDPDQARNLPLQRVFAICQVTQEGKVIFYEGWENGG